MGSLSRCTAALTALLLVACGGSSGSSSPVPGQPSQPSPAPSSSTPLRHIVVIVQENRTFDNFFAGYPGADSSTTGRIHTGRRVALTPIGFWPPAGLDHLWGAATTDWAQGKMNGFDRPKHHAGLSQLYPYSYVRRELIRPYWQMAEHYVLADHMFPTEFGPSFTAHQNLIAGTTEIKAGLAVINLPTLNGQQQKGDCSAPKRTTTDLIDRQRHVLRNAGPRPCFDYPSIADVLDAGGVSWKYYSGFWPNGNSTWNAFGAIRKVYYGPDYANVTKKPFVVLDDAAQGKLPAVSWVIPTPADSDHPGAGSDRGPSWVATVVNAIGEGPDWNSTAIVVLWDDWGGWYDNVPPPQLDYRGLGIRVPCMIISPYAKHGFVDHTQYEFGSILKTIEETFGTGQIGTTDTRATDMFDAFDFTQKPRAFKPFHAKYPPNAFRSEGPSHLLIPDPGDD